ncbi:MAG: acyltransferase family protein [Brevundimonas sp.]
MTADLASTPSRRHDLDWIRVGAFLLLILYHVGMFYVPWGWHVKSSHEVDGLIPAMLLTNPWRLTLLFLVSGAATRFLFDGLERRGAAAGRLAGSRLLRLLPPLVFAMFVIVPPQSYYEIVEALRGYFPGADPYHNAYTADFWVKYATASGNWCDGDGCLITPTWNHMWFVTYLLVYSLLLAALLAATRGALKRLGDLLETALSGWGLLVWPIVFLAAVRWWLAPIFPITHALTDDWYNHALSFSAFLFGFLIVRSEPLKQGFIRIRLSALILGLIGWAGWTAYVLSFPETSAVVPGDALRRTMRVVYAVQQWSFIAAILGYGARYLTRGGPLLRYLTIGVFPFYIAHQTIIVVAGHYLAKLGLPLIAEAGLVIGITVVGCWLTYELARRLGWLGLVLGVRPARALETER